MMKNTISSLLLIIVYGIVVTTAAPGTQENFNRQASAAQACDDPCLICGLLMDYYGVPTGQRYAQSNRYNANNNRAAETVEDQNNPISDNIMKLMSTYHTGGKKRQVESAAADDEEQCLDVCSICIRREKAKLKESVLQQAVISSILKSMTTQK